MTAGPFNALLCTDGRVLAGPATGVAIYAQALGAAQRRLDAMARLVVDRDPTAPPDNGPGRWRRWAAAAWPGTRPVAAADGRRFARSNVFREAQVHFDLYGRVLRLAVAGPPGIAHWSYPLPIAIDGWTNVYTIHDLIPLTDPALTGIDERRHRRLLRRVAARGAHFVTVTETIRAELIDRLGLPSDRVTNCLQPAEPEPVSGREPPADLRAGNYLLVLGLVEARKNIDLVLAAYRRSRVSLPLVIAGPSGWQAAPLEAAITAVQGTVRLRDLDRADVVTLLANARALLMPSLAEGFGLPVAEAMALGTPVVTSASGALAEVAGGAALLVDPRDTEAVARAIGAVAADDALCRHLVKAGRANARRFSAAAFAQRLAGLYGRLQLEGPSRWDGST